MLNKIILMICVTVALLWGAGCMAEPRLHPLIIRTDDGAQLLRVELALTLDEQAKGLMYREKMPEDEGMLFVFPSQRHVSFWMKNTLIPLDLLFIDDKGVIRHIHPMAKPHDETPIPSHHAVLWVLEIAGGQAAARGIKIGDRVEVPNLGNKKQDSNGSTP